MTVEDLSAVSDNLCEIADEGAAGGSLDALHALAQPAPRISPRSIRSS